MAVWTSARTRGGAVLLVVVLLCAFGGLLVAGPAVAAARAALPAGTYCQGRQPDQPATGPTHVMHVVLENESAQDVDASPDAAFQRGTLDAQCGTFGQTNMKSTTHGSEGNYIALLSGLNPAINSGADAAARFSLSDCPPDSTVASCTYGGGHLAATVPSLYSQVEQKYGTTGWKTYADDMTGNCFTNDANRYATANGKNYSKYVVRHNPAVYFRGIACAAQNVPSGNWAAGQGPLYADLTGGTVPNYSFVVPNDIENGHDPVSVAGGHSQIANIDNYLASFMGLVQRSPQYQSGELVVMVTYDEGFKCGPGDCAVGENCAAQNISPVLTSCDVKTWVVGRYVGSRTYTGYMNQFGLLAATQRLLGLSPLLGHAADGYVPDIVNGTTADPNPFGLAATGGGGGTPTVPAAPTNVAAVPGDGQVALTWNPPADGGSAVTDYAVSYRPTGTTAWTTFPDGLSPAAGATVTGLTDGTAYEFTVTAVNGVGPGPPSTPAVATPRDAGTPVELLPDPGFEAGNGGWVPFTVGTFTRVTSPVRSGGSALRIAATGAGAALVGMTQNSVIGSSAAGQPYTAQCWVQPTGPNLNVQLRLLEYTQNFGSFTSLQTTTVATLPTGTWTPVQVTGTAVRAAERVIPQIYSTQQTTGTGSLLYDDCSVTAGTPTPPPPTAPGAPTGVIATAGDGTVTVTFTAPASTGGSPITGYAVTASPGGASVSGSGSPLTLTGLANGTAYTVTVTATNSIGTGPPSATTAPVTPATVPSAPDGVTATPGDGAATVSFTAPADTGGAPITGYTVTASPGGATATGPTGPLTVTGLTNGTGYTFTVIARNAAGPGLASGPSDEVTPVAPPATAPGAPTSVSAAPGDGSATVFFAAPASDGGSPITSYTVTTSPGGTTVSGSASPLTVAPLTNGTAYTFTVTATNDVGAGPDSAPSSPVTPAPPPAVPGAPTSVTAQASNAAAVVSFAPPSSTGGSPITGYTVVSTPGSVTATGASGPITVGGLTNGVSYTFTVTARNDAGPGPASAPSAAVTPMLELLPDAGFESGNGGWVPFNVGTFTRVSTPVHGGATALRIAATGTAAALVGMTQNSVVANSVTGRVYTASCYVRPTAAGLNVRIRFLEYTQNFGSFSTLQTTTVAGVPANAWTLVSVTSTALRSGERMIPQIYSTNSTTTTGSLLYDDCSVSYR